MSASGAAGRPLRVAQLTPGTGNFYCGSCLRDHALVKGLRARGHDALMVPLYLPQVVDVAEQGQPAPVFLGGIGIYLAERFPFFRRMPPWVGRLLSSGPMLRLAAGMAGLTAPRDLGRTTVAMLGEETPAHGPELDRLIGFLRGGLRPDVVHLSNSLLAGMARALREGLGARVVTSFQGEDNFLDALPEPYRAEAWRLLGERCGELDGFIAPSAFCAARMGERLGLAPGRITVVPNGIESSEFALAAEPPAQPTIGFLARMCHGKGLGLLVDAFILMRRDGRIPGVRLRVAGARTAADAAYVAGLRSKLESAGLGAEAEFLPNLDPGEKRSFLQSLSAFCVPAIAPESFGLYLLEAWASGLPVVAPRAGSFPELLSATGGGLLCESENPGDLAWVLGELLADPGRARAMGERARGAVRENFGVATMAEGVETVFRHVVATVA